jgi:hypothetical protein
MIDMGKHQMNEAIEITTFKLAKGLTASLQPLSSGFDQ